MSTGANVHATSEPILHLHGYFDFWNRFKQDFNKISCLFSSKFKVNFKNKLEVFFLNKFDLILWIIIKSQTLFIYIKVKWLKNSAF